MKKKSLKEKFGMLMAPVAFVSGLLFIATFPLLEWSQDNHYQGIADICAGYMFGYVSGFAGFAINKIWKGDWDVFMSDWGPSKWISLFSLLVVLGTGLTGTLLDVFGDTSGSFNAAFWIAAFAVSTCLVPFLDDLKV